MHENGVDRVRRWVLEDFGVPLRAVNVVGYGADALAVLWCGVGTDGARYAIKLSGGGTPAGLVVSAHLAAIKVPGIPGPVPTRAGRLWSQREGRRLSMVPWVSGGRAIHTGMGAAEWRAFGELLAHVHATEISDSLATLLPREEHTHERIAASVRVLDHRLRVEDVEDPLARAGAQEWRDATEEVETLLEHADRIGRDPHVRRMPGVVCHGDPHLGNVLLGADDEVWLIDWDDAVLAPRERDLMFVLGGVLAFAPVSAREQTWFFQGYGAVEPDPALLAYYRCTRALEDLVDPVGQVLDAHRYAEPERADALWIVRGILSPTGLVHQALASLRDLG